MKYTAGWKYRLVEDEVFQTGIFPPEDLITEYVTLTKEGLLTCKRHYCFDGPSGEIKILKVFTIDITRDTPDSMRPSCGHDSKAYLMRIGLLSHIWYHQMNKEFLEDLITDGMWEWKAKAWHKVIDTVDDYIKPESKKKVHTAP